MYSREAFGISNFMQTKDKPGEFDLIEKIRKLFEGLTAGAEGCGSGTCGSQVGKVGEVGSGNPDLAGCSGQGGAEGCGSGASGSGSGGDSGSHKGTCEGIGDDCAVIPISADESMVVTTDMLVEDVHFLRGGTTAFLLGRKALAVNLSDVAAIGARPFASFLSVSLPEGTAGRWADEFMEGYHSVSARYGVALLGGDTTFSPDRIVISVTAMGRVANGNIKRRSAAIVGDKILVSGNLGGSSQGLIDIIAGRTDTPAVHLHNDPAPQVEEGLWLGGQPGVHAMIDLSDGLASDLLHILEESGAGAAVAVENIPREAGVTVEQAVAGGEDYKLLFTADPAEAERICAEFRQRFGYTPAEIGTITAGKPLIAWTENGRAISPSWKGYTHF